MALLRYLLMKLEWFARKYLVFNGAYKFRASRTMLLKVKKSLGEIFCVRNVFLISFSKLFLSSASSFDKKAFLVSDAEILI